jgi:monoamine oxidase
MTDRTRRELLRLAAAAGAGATLSGALARPALAAPTQDYDDGNDAVPGGLAGEPERVIVVGAGWAGLTVANALRNAGVDHVVVDGRRRIGGRARTVSLAGIPIDLGCSWIHGPIGNPMTRYAEQAGVARVSGNVEQDALILRFYDAHLDREVNQVERVQPLGHLLNFAQNDSATIADELGPRASVRDGAQVYLDRQGLEGDARRQTEFLIRSESEFVYGTAWGQLSLEHWSWANAESDYLGTGQGEFPVGGYGRLIRAMAGSGSVRLGHRVTAIELTRRGVLVRARAGRRRVALRGSHVVVTAPLGVLQRGLIGFEPGLPAGKRAAMARVGYGAVEKVAMVFDEPFWNDLTHTHIVFVSDHGALEFPIWIDMQRSHGVPALVAFCGGPFARTLGGLGHEARVALTLTRLEEILGRPVPRPRAVATTGWQHDRYSAGSYSAMLVGSSPADLDTLAEPVRGRVLFAGEATSRARHSTADGAMSSGIREAKRLLRRPAVGLSAG